MGGLTASAALSAVSAHRSVAARRGGAWGIGSWADGASSRRTGLRPAAALYSRRLEGADRWEKTRHSALASALSAVKAARRDDVGTFASTMKRAATRATIPHKTTRPNPVVDPRRIRTWKETDGDSNQPVVYWMGREQRVRDNWALLHAIHEAQRTHSPLAVAFALVAAGSGRQLGFLIRGLRALEPKLKRLNVPFFLLQGRPEEHLPALARRSQARLVVMDYSPLRHDRDAKQKVMEGLECGLDEVDGHNVVPIWEASGRREYAAYTLRPKIHAKLPEFLTPFPPLRRLDPNPWPEHCLPDAVDWDAVLEGALAGSEVGEVAWVTPGEDAATAALEQFVRKRLRSYAARRNDPGEVDGQSGLSPYLHFGHLAPQRAALEASKERRSARESVEQFLEELIVRRELSDNFCHYEESYDRLAAAPSWAQETLQSHLSDDRSYLYTKEELEAARTHEDLWNACQKELVLTGKLHGYMRMYWAKKILEWTARPEEALEISIELNDKYSLDGVDPNGYVGCQWSIGGVHDRAFKERSVIGKIRPMTYAGCKRKFDIAGYMERIEELGKELSQ